MPNNMPALRLYRFVNDLRVRSVRGDVAWESTVEEVLLAPILDVLLDAFQRANRLPTVLNAQDAAFVFPYLFGFCMKIADGTGRGRNAPWRRPLCLGVFQSILGPESATSAWAQVDQYTDRQDSPFFRALFYGGGDGGLVLRGHSPLYLGQYFDGDLD